MRRVVSVTVLVILLAHLAGAYLYFVVRLGEIRMEQRHKLALLPNDQLQVLRVPAAQFRSGWMEEREMEWHGKMYDIARVEQDGQHILVYCLHDEDEDNLLSLLAAVVESSRHDNEEAPDSLIEFSMLEFDVSSVLLPQAPESSSIEAATAYAVADLSLLDGPAAPPPRR